MATHCPKFEGSPQKNGTNPAIPTEPLLLMSVRPQKTTVQDAMHRCLWHTTDRSRMAA
ncbi:Hypothetical protein (plasmid) [Pseudomonas putida]|nr:Hypothetical protein [Pseudomonas putida]